MILITKEAKLNYDISNSLSSRETKITVEMLIFSVKGVRIYLSVTQSDWEFEQLMWRLYIDKYYRITWVHLCIEFLIFFEWKAFNELKQSSFTWLIFNTKTWWW